MKNKIITYGFIIFIALTLSINVITSDKLMSTFERRKLLQFPTKDIFDNFEDYAIDQFVLRDELLSINSYYNRVLLRRFDYNNVYYEHNKIFEINYPTNYKNIDNFKDKLNNLNELLTTTNNYYAIIPDKGYYLSDNHLKLDYDYIYNMDINMQNINIKDSLVLDDYYNTDIHLKQESYLKLIPILCNNMKLDYKEYTYKKNTIESFIGSSYSKVGNYVKSDKIVYLKNDYMKDITVKHLEYPKKQDIYDLNELNKVDNYNLFLSGPSALIEISNPNVIQKELIIFRDSYASSLVPLLIPYYSKITMIDLRYMDSSLLNEYISFDKQDVLFLYSTNIINNSYLLK